MLPLFPLEIVLFPKSKYPLHIFEEHYKIMVNESIEYNQPFGIVSVIDSQISSVGTYTSVAKVVKEYQNGSKDIVVKGGERFLIHHKESHRDGYNTGEVSEYNDSGFDLDFESYSKTYEHFNRILNITEIKLEESYWRNLENTSFKSFKMAEKSGLDLKQRQKLLEMKSENERLKFLEEHFERINIYLDRREGVKDIISGDGYLDYL